MYYILINVLLMIQQSIKQHPPQYLFCYFKPVYLLQSIITPSSTYCNWWHWCCCFNHQDDVSRISSSYIFPNHIHLLVDHTVYLSCLHLQTTSQVSSQDASNLCCVVMSIKIMYTYICERIHMPIHIHAHTCTHQQPHFAASKLLWHIELIRTNIMFCKVLLRLKLQSNIFVN